MANFSDRFGGSKIHYPADERRCSALLRALSIMSGKLTDWQTGRENKRNGKRARIRKHELKNQQTVLLKLQLARTLAFQEQKEKKTPDKGG